MLDLKRVLAAAPKGPNTETPRKLTTPWGDVVAREAAAALARGDADAPEKSYLPRSEYPRPTFVREDTTWQSLNGWWHCGFAPLDYDPLADVQEACAGAPRPEAVATPILVPFSPEADLSGVGRQLQPNEAMWYAREFRVPNFDAAKGQRVLLHFQGVDDTCAVWVNDTLVGTHQGGYLPFAFDITDALAETGTTKNGEDTAADSADGGAPTNSGEGDVAGTPGANGAASPTATLTLCVVDPSDAGIQLRGKQRLQPGNIYYTAQSGIWQPVWLEVVPAARVLEAQVTPQVDANSLTTDTPRGTLTINAQVTGHGKLRATILFRGNPLATAEAQAIDGAVSLEFPLAGIELWSPETPTMYEVALRYVAPDGGRPDVARVPFAFRHVSVEAVKDADGVTRRRFFLNGKPYFCKGVLDQGYWPDGLMTAPDVAALEADIRAMKDAGFTMLRKHIKVEAPRFYALCDRLGMLVWQDMVSGGNNPEPLYAMYLPTLFTRSWSRFSDTTAAHQAKLGAGNPRYRNLWTETAKDTVRLLSPHPSVVCWVLMNEGWGQFDSAAACDMVRKLDPTRPVHAVSGWYDQGAGDFFGVHNYFRPQRVFGDPFASRDEVGRASVTCEFGGLVHNVAGHAQFSQSFGYDMHDTIKSYQQALSELLAKMNALEAEGLTGYVYTQVSDVEEETNGILTYDRRVNKLTCSG